MIYTIVQSFTTKHTVAIDNVRIYDSKFSVYNISEHCQWILPKFTLFGVVHV